MVRLKDKLLLFDEYDSGPSDMSITDINRDTREIILLKRHTHEMDARIYTQSEMNSRIHAALGRAWDAYASKVIEKDPDYIGHLRLYYPARYKNKTYIISGEIDCYHIPTKTIYDFKLVSMAKAKRLEYDSLDYTRQLNGYAWLFRDGYTDPECTKKFSDAFDYKVDALKLCVTCRDFDIFQSTQDAVTEIDIELKDIDATKMEFMLHLKKLVDWSPYPDKDIPYCSASYRWEGSKTYPVYKKNKSGAKAKQPRALPHTGSFQSEIEAKQFIQSREDKDELYFAERGGTPVKCESYCALSGIVCKYLDTRKELI